jgi:hypothetical protein
MYPQHNHNKKEKITVKLKKKRIGTFNAIYHIMVSSLKLLKIVWVGKFLYMSFYDYMNVFRLGIAPEVELLSHQVTYVLLSSY